jgi:hypothetical protein
MSSTLLTPSVIAKEALMQLENNLVIGNLVHRAYEAEYGVEVNGNKIGSTVTIRKPVRYSVRSGAVAQLQDTQEGSTTIKVNSQQGVDLQFASSDMTLKITEFSERYIKPAMSQLANKVDMDLYGLAVNGWNWTGTPGQTMNSFGDFASAAQRMDEMAIPGDDRRAILAPADYWAMVSSFTTLYAKQGQTAETALRKAELGRIANLDVYSAQNVFTYTAGTRTNTTPLFDGTGNISTTFSQCLTNYSMNITLKGAGNAATFAAGDIFTIAGVYAVNPVSKAALPYLKQFVVNTAATSTSGGAVTLNISPPIILSGDPYQTVTAAPVDGSAISWVGSASTGYSQNLFFHKNALALCMVPMEMPDGAVKKARETYKGLSVRLIGQYDIINDINLYRLDILYGVKAIYPELLVRASGSA